MNYLSYDKRRSNSNLKKIIFIIVVCLFVVVIAQGFIIKKITSVSQVAGVALSSVLPASLRSNKTLLSENALLREQVVKLQSDVVINRVLVDENAKLKYVLGRSGQASTSNKILAVITQRPLRSPIDIFILDVGVESGVQVDDGVLFGNLILGKIVEVGNGYSKAELYSAPNNKFQGVISRTSISLEVRGLGGGGFEALVPIGADVVVGDTFILPSISSKVYGQVKNVEMLESEGFKRILFTLPINPNEITEVIINK
jgi:cell shape-determining protein MreC